MPAPKDPIKYKEYCENISKGNIGKKQSPETIAKKVNTRKQNGSYVSKMKGKKRPPRTPEWSKNISIAKLCSVPWNKDKKTGPLSPEHRKSIGISNSKPKPPFTQQHKDNIRKVMLGPANARRGAKHKPETIERIKLARSKQKLPMQDSKPEIMMQIALSLNNIKYTKHKMITDSMGFFHQVDIFIEPNICIEVDGDYIHGNPDKYMPDDKIKKGKMAKEIWANDIRINHKLNLLGYNVIRIWEKDIKNNLQDSAMRIINLIRILGVVP